MIGGGLAGSGRACERRPVTAALDLLGADLGLSAGQWAALAVGALLVGFAKTAVGGVASISVAIFAAVLPARASTGALLPLLIAGDMFALYAYRKHADWQALVRLFPSVAVGVLLGVWFVGVVDDVVMRRTIGAVLLILVGVHLATRRRQMATDRPRTMLAVGFGTAAGFTTMVANAGGAAMSLYLLLMRMSKLGFLGTTAWFFFLVNCFKVPFSVGLGLLTWESLSLNVVLLPALVVGAIAGRRLIDRIDQATFEGLVLAFTVLSALNLLR